MDGLGESWEEESGESENGWRTPLAGCFVVGQFIGAWIIVIGVVRETCWGMGAGRMRIGVINGPSGRGVRDTGLVVRYSHQPVLRTMQELRGPLFFDHEFFCFGQVRPSAEYEGYDSDGGHVHVAGDLEVTGWCDVSVVGGADSANEGSCEPPHWVVPSGQPSIAGRFRTRWSFWRPSSMLDSWQEYWRTVEFWLASKGKSLPAEVQGP